MGTEGPRAAVGNRETGWPPNTLVLWEDSVSVGGLTQAEDALFMIIYYLTERGDCGAHV